MKQVIIGFALLFLTSCIDVDATTVIASCKKVHECIKGSTMSYKINIYEEMECTVKVEQEGVLKVAFVADEIGSKYALKKRAEAVCDFFKDLQ